MIPMMGFMILFGAVGLLVLLIIIGQVMRSANMKTKPKRSTDNEMLNDLRFALGDDGELVEIDQSEKRKHHTAE